MSPLAFLQPIVFRALQSAADLNLTDPSSIDWRNVDKSTIDPWSLDPALLDELSPYGYVPTKSVCIIFLAWFALSTLIHLGEAVLGKQWFMIPTCALAGAGECIAWGARYWSSTDPLQSTPFMMQISTAILAPTPLLAATFIIVGIIIDQLGPCYSRLTPKKYSLIFLSCDIVALVVQGAGGGIASSSDDPTMGANIMLGGIVFQTIVITGFSFCSGEFLYRYLKNRPVPGKSVTRGYLYTELKLMIGALITSIVLLSIRAIYRIIELTGGWDGPVITTEVYFNVFDGLMVALVITILNAFHPWLLLMPGRTLVQEGEFAPKKSNKAHMKALDPEGGISGAQSPGAHMDGRGTYLSLDTVQTQGSGFKVDSGWR